MVELLPELMSKEPRLEISTGKVIVVDNIPKVGVDKKEKLKTILNKLLINYGKITHEEYPEGENAVLKGYQILKFFEFFGFQIFNLIFRLLLKDTCLLNTITKYQPRKQWPN